MTTAARLRNLEDIFRLSPVQQGMLYHTLTAPGTGIYHEQFTMSYGAGFDPDLFVAAWRREVARQPVLRTSLLWEDLDEPVQVVHRSAEVPVERLDWRELDAAEQEERLAGFRAEDRRRGFDLTRPPLTRLALIRVGDGSWRVVWSYHHVLLDGWSAGLVIREISRIYLALAQGAEPDLPERRPFRDYIRWLRKQDLSEAREYWRRRFGDFSEPTPLVVDRPPERGEDRGYELRATRLSARDSERIRRFAQEHRVTQNTLVQAAYALLLSRYSGQDDVVFGVTVSGRPPSLRGVDGMIGCFINTLPVRVTMDPEEEVLPCLAERVAAAGGGRLLCWSAGCASGEEAYTLSILWTLRLAGEHPGVEPFVLATDVDPHLLARARRGVFPEGAMKELPKEWIDAAFDPVPGGAAAEDEGGRLLRLRDRFRRPVRLACADLREAMPEARFHLVLCRNLAFVYYEEELQRRIAADIARRVPSGGYLAIGGHETLPSGAEGWEDGAEGLYCRDASSPGLPSARMR